MAGIGLYGVYYAKATVTSGVITAYQGVQTMGKAISASFEPNDKDQNPLYANNGIAEYDASASAGGTLTVTVDHLAASARADLFGLTQTTATVTVNSTSVSGTGFDDTGSETAAVVGVAFVRSAQKDQSRDNYEAVIFSHCTFSAPTDEYQTMEESVDWQTVELEAGVASGAALGTFPWRKRYTFPSQDAAVQFITDYFAVPSP